MNPGRPRTGVVRARYVAAILFSCMVAAACKPAGPVDYPAGRFACEHCRMSIVDIKFRAQTITAKGKVHHFDSIECSRAWSRDHDHAGASHWVADFNKPRKWLSFDKALILRSAKLRSPMGAGLSAHAAVNDLNLARKRFGGRRLNKSELDAYVLKWMRGLKSHRAGKPGTKGHGN